MRISFASERPGGSDALVIPIRGDEVLAQRLAGLAEPARGLVAAAAEAQRFEREAGAVAETFVPDGQGARRLLLVGLGANPGEQALYERAGGAIAARLLLSGEIKAVVDLTGLGAGAEAAARIGFGIAARSWRHDHYRTRLSRKQKPSLEEVTIVGAGDGAEQAWKRKEALLDGISFARELVTEPPNVVYPETFVERCRKKMAPLGIAIDALDENKMRELGMGALLGVGQGSARPP